MGDPVTTGLAAEAALGGTGIVSASALPGVVGGMGALAPAVNPVSASLFSGMAMPATITGIGKDLAAVNTFMNQNPMLSKVGLDLASSMMQQPQARFAQPGQVSRGQIQPMDYMSLLNPQQQQVLMPATPSLI